MTRRPHRILIVAFALACCAGRAGPVPGASAAPADASDRARIEDQGRRFVVALDSSDSTAWRAAARELFAPSTLARAGETRIAGLFARLRDQLGEVTYHHSEMVVAGEPPSVRRSLHVFVRDARESRWHDLQFVLEPDPPHRLENLVFIADVTEPIALPNGRFDSPATLRWLNGYIDRLVADDGLAGGLLIAEGDRVLLERTFGPADPAGRRRIADDSRFGMASGGKMFTALLLARLVEQGRVRFEDTLARVVPGLGDWPPARTVTLDQLLSHVSGIGDYWTDAWEGHRADMKRTADYLPWIRRAGIRFAPGERFEYSNSNYILLGIAIESLTGRPYADVLRDSLLAPLGMSASGLPAGRSDPGAVVPMRRAGKGWVGTGFDDAGSPAGGCRTTLADLFEFARALAGGRIVPPAMLRRMTTSRTRGLPGGGHDYGEGFILERGGGTFSYGHGGIAPGVNFELRIFPDLDVTLIAFSNQDNGAYDDLRRNATRLVTGER